MAHEWTEQELTWATVKTSKQINVRQLAALLGTDDISVNGKPLGESVEKEIRANCTQAKLDEVMAAYSKDDNFGVPAATRRMRELGKKPVLTPPELEEAVRLLLQKEG